MITSCLESIPGHVCGIFGTCVVQNLVNENSGVSEKCSCEQGWEQTGEMQLFLIPQEALDNELGLCISNPVLYRALYISAGAAAVLGLVVQLAMLRKRKQLIRLAPFFLALGFSIGICAYRLVFLDTALFGKDVLFTVLVANMSAFVMVAANIFLKKYLKYVTTKIRASKSNAAKRFERYRIINNIMICFDVLIFQLAWITLIIPDQETTGQYILRGVFGAMSLVCLYQLFLHTSLLSQVMMDMKKIISIASRGTAKSGNEDQEEGGFVHASGRKRYDKLLKKLVPRTKLLKKLNEIIYGLFTVILLLSAAWQSFFVLFGYVIPIFIFIWTLPNFAAIFLASGKSKAKERTGLNDLMQNRKSSLFRVTVDSHPEPAAGGVFSHDMKDQVTQLKRSLLAAAPKPIAQDLNIEKDSATESRSEKVTVSI